MAGTRDPRASATRKLRARVRGHGRSAAKLAALATVLIALLYVAACAVMDAFVARRVLWEVDAGLSSRISVVSSFANPLTSRTIPGDVGTDGAPVFMWWVSPSRATVPLTVGSPALPRAATASAATPLSIRTATGATFRFSAAPYRGGLLVAGQDVAGPSHIDRVLLAGELLLAPVLLGAVFAGVFLIGLRASAPVEAARRRLQELTADASHELRTPLTVIEAEIELARTEPAELDAAWEALDHVGRESKRLKAIVENLLWLARFDAAPARPAPSPTDLAAVASTEAQRFAAVASGRGIRLRATVDTAWVDVPHEWLDRLCGTLLDNACRYAPDGGIVRVTSGAHEGRAYLRVEDDGPGVAPEERELLFDRFHRATEQPGGAGLGLAIADSVVRSTGGRWRVDASSLGGLLMEVSWRRSAPLAGSPPATRAHSDTVGV